MDDTAMLASHNICTLALAMRDCATCRFNPTALKPVPAQSAEIKADQKEDHQGENKNETTNIL